MSTTITHIRKQAALAFSSLPFPHNDEWVWFPARSFITAKKFSPCTYDVENREVFEQKGVRFLSLFDRSVVVSRYLSGFADFEDDKLLAYHTMHLDDGFIIRFPPSFNDTEELVLRVTVGSGSIVPHIAVIAEKYVNARISIVYQSSGKKPSPVVGAERVFVKEGASLFFASWQDVSNKSTFFTDHRSYIGKDASLNYLAASTGASVSKQFNRFFLEGERAKATLSGVFGADGQRRTSFTTYQFHKVPNCFSDLLFKGILSDSSIGFYRGLIKVYPGAQKTHAYQANRNLLLSSNAKAHSLPFLEISANDVFCTHGATVGKINEEQLFYLTSRGIEPYVARQMIVEGFASHVFERFGRTSLRNPVLHRLCATI